MKKKGNRISRALRLIYLKLFRVNDTPNKIALGFGIGVFSGIMPGIGPLAALFLASLIRVNKASALLGSLLTNTWLSIIIFAFSVKIGSSLMGLNWQEVNKAWKVFLEHFHVLDLLKISILEMILPVIIGYIIVGLCSSLVIYLVILIILKRLNKYRHLKNIR
jgi:uncharacterized protein (DUF2062 family)